MTKDLIRSLFNMDDEVLVNLIDNAVKSAKEYDFLKELEKKLNTDFNDKDESYFHSSEKQYDNGKLVKKSEKEYVNGECTKDEVYDETKTNDDETEKKRQRRLHKASHLYHRLKVENESLKNQIEDMTHYIDSLNDKIKKLNAENESLSQIVDNVKRCF